MTPDNQITALATGLNSRSILFLSAMLIVSPMLASCSQEDLLSAHQLTPKVTTVRVAEATPPAKALRTRKVASLSKTRDYDVKVTATTEVASYGRGPYICSPSGFGHKSHCVARAFGNLD